MGKTIINGIEYSGSGATNASQLPYDNTMNTKEKIDENAAAIAELNSKTSVTKEDLGNNLTLYRVGSFRLLLLNSSITKNKNHLGDLPIEDRPSSVISVPSFIQNYNYPSKMRIGTNGSIDVYTYNNQQTDTGVYCLGQCCWFVD